MQTLYRPVPGYDDLYAGMDASIVKAGYGELKQKIGPKGYLYVCIPGIRGSHESHRLIASAYLGPREKGVEVRHGEGGKLDNTPGNFCYGTHQQNMQDAIRDGRHAAVHNLAKTECPQGHGYTPENTYIDARGSRHCRTCRADRSVQDNIKRKAKRNGN